ncbi:TetR/AcrR family transcriptional regulator [Actinocrispum wychmicini]|uniref:TetR family transcriptional regulator n=1 Tax=Actinocrispum wychmicini TaxID=1213861 RepID=A0A4R2JYT3_9PSEU|nr:TetR/AcrR family transcriptional regulator [Actinocrispum wychmicini]TCO59275.1 TetR family transcriptional regulator [Actinocrispum wychmicini]
MPDDASRRERLVDAALVVFARHGVEGASIKDIGREAGVAPALIYHYFPSKEALLAAAVDKHGFLPELRVVLTIPSREPASEVLMSMARGLYERLSERIDLVRVVMTRSQTHPEMRARMAELTGEAETLLARYLRARVAAGELRDHPAEVAARTLLFTVVMWRLTDAPAEELDAAIDVIVAGLSAVSPRLSRD